MIMGQISASDGSYKNQFTLKTDDIKIHFIPVLHLARIKSVQTFAAFIAK